MLRRVAQIEGLLRIRFTTSHPKDLSPSLMQCFADIEPLCPHIQFLRNSLAVGVHILPQKRDLPYAALNQACHLPNNLVAASRLDGKVEEKVKLQRLQTLQSLQERITLEKNEVQVGQTTRVLVEGPSQVGGSQLSGRTPQNRVVNFQGPPELVGEEIPVLISAGHAHSLEGVVCVEDNVNLKVVKERSWCGK
ncbi:MAG: TRAM domain-containing protein [Deltaproteobacteria bacterium]|nr:TRAM domain-containing protein [Deltaproteobacteria bacterium]